MQNLVDKYEAFNPSKSNHNQLLVVWYRHIINNGKPVFLKGRTTGHKTTGRLWTCGVSAAFGDEGFSGKQKMFFHGGVEDFGV